LCFRMRSSTASQWLSWTKDQGIINLGQTQRLVVLRKGASALFLLAADGKSTMKEDIPLEYS
jgi:hypothetical protein